MLAAVRDRARKRFRIEQEREALHRTQSLMKRSSDPQLDLEVWGEQNAAAYMAIGWHPKTQTWEGKVPVYRLTIENWEKI